METIIKVNGMMCEHCKKAVTVLTITKDKIPCVC